MALLLERLCLWGDVENRKKFTYITTGDETAKNSRKKQLR